jgi:hypothetical protein
MINRTDVTPQKITFVEHLHYFLQSYFWGCKEGHKLRTTYKQQIEQSLHNGLELGTQCFESWGMKSVKDGAFFPYPDHSLKNSFLDCYAHTQICTRCVSVEKLTCKEGYGLMEERDSAFDRTSGLGIGFKADDSRPNAELSPEQREALLYTSTTQQVFLDHRNTCPICIMKPPIGRYTIAAWNVQAVCALKSS